MKTIRHYCIALASMLVMTSPVGAHRQEDTTPVHYLVVSMDDNSESRFALADAPRITFSNGDLLVECQGSTLSFALDAVKDYHFAVDNVPTGIKTTTTATDADTKPVISLGKATFNGLRQGDIVAVYAMDGNLIATSRAGNDGQIVVDLSSLPTGIYILKAPNKSYKIQNR